jgi:hypothetical protein
VTLISSGHPYGAVPRATTGSFRIPFDTTIASDPYGAILFSQDPLFGIDYDSPFPDSISQTPFFLTSSIPTVESIPNDQKKYPSNFLDLSYANIFRSNSKQKRSNHPQQPVLFVEPSISDYQLWQQNIPSIPLDKPIENKYENDSRSFLGK